MIEAQNLVKSFGSHRVLDGVNFRIDRGESVVIIGRSGGGKSILLKHIAGLMEPDSGQVLIAGESLTGLDERELLRVRSKFGMLFQSAALFDSMSVEENVAFALMRSGKWTSSEIERKVAEALDMVELAGHTEENAVGIVGRHAQARRFGSGARLSSRNCAL